MSAEYLLGIPVLANLVQKVKHCDMYLYQAMQLVIHTGFQRYAECLLVLQ
jgi:hypothetical protein